MRAPSATVSEPGGDVPVDDAGLVQLDTLRTLDVALDLPGDHD